MDLPSCSSNEEEEGEEGKEGDEEQEAQEASEKQEQVTVQGERLRVEEKLNKLEREEGVSMHSDVLVPCGTGESAPNCTVVATEKHPTQQTRALEELMAEDLLS